MADSLTIEMINGWKKKEELEAHNYLGELIKPNELNDLIMTEVNFIIEKLSRQHDATEVSGHIATLTELIQKRKSKKKYNGAQVTYESR